MSHRAHPQLRELDALALGLSYRGWQKDVEEAEKNHVRYPALFGDFLSGMRRKQRIAENDRSHPQLVALDALKTSGLSYRGWQKDVEEAEKNHVRYPALFGDFLSGMRRKQNALEPAVQRKARRSRRREWDGDYDNVCKKPRRGEVGGNKGNRVENMQCVVCMDAEKDYAFVPCGHICVCGTCAGLIGNEDGLKCPLCMQASDLVLRVFS